MAKVDIIMGIYNCEEYLSESIESLLKQTFNDWRLIMCEDKSTDGTLKIAEKYKEKYPDKIVLLKNEKNMGLNFTLNRCLENTNAEFIARQDGDDQSRPDRLEKEVKYLDTNPDVAIVSTNIELFDDDGRWGNLQYVEDPKNIDFLVHTPFCHPAAMVRRDAFIDVGGYTVGKKYLRVEDYHLWFKLYAKGYIGHNIQDYLYLYRDDRAALGRRTWMNRRNEYYVRKIGFRMINIPWYLRLYKFRPLVLGLMPKSVAGLLHKRKFGDYKNKCVQK